MEKKFSNKKIIGYNENSVDYFLQIGGRLNGKLKGKLSKLKYELDTLRQKIKHLNS